MSFARPSTPSTTPRKPVQASSRPSSRASSRPSSPVKPAASASLNSPLPRPSSALGINALAQGRNRGSSFSDKPAGASVKRTGGGGRASPTKPATRPLSTHANGSTSTLKSAQVTSTSSFSSPLSASSTAQRARQRKEPPRASDASSTCASSIDETSDDDVPRRRAGFGPIQTPMKKKTRGAETETEDDDPGFLTAKEGGMGESEVDVPAKNQGRSSVVYRGEGEEVTPTDEDGEETETETETEEEEKDGKQENVVVCLRVRPSKSSASSSSSPSIYSLSPSDAKLTLTTSHPSLVKRGGAYTKGGISDEYEFRFDLLHVAPAKTDSLYDAKIRPVVQAALGGFNGTVFAYGQTASGKTHTMMGSPSEPGIIPLAIDELFTSIHKQNTHRTYSLRVSFLEIYNEHLRDLLAPASPGPSSSTATIRQPEIVEGGTVKNLEERAVSMPQEVLEVLKEGENRRRVGATDWNERSSRSHCVFIVTIESMSRSGNGSARTSKLNLIDLAGSESATGQEERRKEGSFINKSLLTLGTVIGKLTESGPLASNGAAHIPYRDSKLTRLLQPALSGNSRVAVVCTVSPDVEQATETLSTLKFAKRAKMVVTKAERGVLVTDQMMLKRYAAQVEKLQQQIKLVESGNVLRERDLAAQRADEAERRGKQAQDALAEKELELSRLREQLAHTKSLILTGPTLEANARRVSGSFNMPMMSPSRSRSLNMGPKRVVSEMSALGLGTPSRSGRTLGGEASWRSGLSESVGGRLAEEDESKEKEAALARQLEEAESKLAAFSSTEGELATLRSQVDQLQRSSSLARLDAEKSHLANQDRRERIRVLEAELAEVRERLREAEAERERLAGELSSMKAEVDELKKASGEAIAASASLKEAEDALALAQEDVRTKDRLVADLQATVAAVERQLAHKEAAAKLPDARDETIASFEREVASIKQELSAVAASKATAIQAALDQGSDVRKERDLALKLVEEAEGRVKAVEELAELQTKRHEAAEQQTQKEKEAAVAALQAEMDRLTNDLAAKVDKVAQLQRAVDVYERLEAQRAKYEADQRFGTDMLKSRMAELQARTSTPTPKATPHARSFSAASASSTLSSSTSSNSDHVELQIRNGELLSRIADLERQLENAQIAGRAATPAAPRQGDVFRRKGSVDLSKRDGPIDGAEKKELQATIEVQKKQLVETQATAEDWRQRYLAAQRLLDKLTGVSRDDATSPTPTDENLPPPSRASLSELNLHSSDSSHSQLRKSSSSRRAPLASPIPASLSSRPPHPHSPQPSYSGVWTKNAPPPLPTSPYQLSAKKERKHRRETIAKDLLKLKETNAVQGRREGWDSPASSPTKAGFGAAGMVKSGSESIAGSPKVEVGNPFSASMREKKRSWE
ncbi:hypothetical protein JCM1840_000153 [Sporobolomyces johnsonii]